MRRQHKYKSGYQVRVVLKNHCLGVLHLPQISGLAANAALVTYFGKGEIENSVITNGHLQTSYIM